MIAAKCPSCGSSLDVPDEYVGCAVKCAGCSHEFTARDADYKNPSKMEGDAGLRSEPFLKMAVAFAAGAAFAGIFMAVHENNSHAANQTEALRISAPEKKMISTQNRDAIMRGREYRVQEDRVSAEMGFRWRENDARDAYRDGKINLAEREAILTRIADEKEKKEEWYKAILNAPID